VPILFQPVATMIMLLLLAKVQPVVVAQAPHSTRPIVRCTGPSSRARTGSS
jgi:hypothetical protein